MLPFLQSRFPKVGVILSQLALSPRLRWRGREVWYSNLGLMDSVKVGPRERACKSHDGNAYGKIKVEPSFL